ncbi:MAG: hypothetical protein ACRC5M_01165 [Anaeroplasmataceae bacterium]
MSKYKVVDEKYEARQRIKTNLIIGAVFFSCFIALFFLKDRISNTYLMYFINSIFACTMLICLELFFMVFAKKKITLKYILISSLIIIVVYIIGLTIYLAIK